LTTVALATPAPVVLAPAMNQQMWRDQATTVNVRTLRERGVHMVGPAEGEQACGDVGPGRMEEPALIAQAVCSLFETGLLAGKRVVITAGPTREALDPVRYITNRSSGKMGYALARAAAEAGAITTLVSGPVTLETPANVRRLQVQSAEDMLKQCLELLPECDVFIACAAVADYRPAAVQPTKIKKGAEHITLELVRNPDIVATVSASDNRPFTAGFAAETNDVEAYARDKMQRKGLDMIIANDVSDPSIGFNSDQNAATVLWRGGQREIGPVRKDAMAREIIELLAGLLDPPQ
jgi:phosphopantothenoylcysteine decarboxylase/phosphopantothenate--cysteine ligase